MKARKFDRITVNPAQMNGQPCIRGMRLTVRRVLETLVAHGDIGSVQREHPEIEVADIVQAIGYAAASLDDAV